MWTKKDDEKLKIAMIKKYGNVNYTKLAKELSTTRQTIYNVRANLFNDSENMLREWSKSQAK